MFSTVDVLISLPAVNLNSPDISKCKVPKTSYKSVVDFGCVIVSDVLFVLILICLPDSMLISLSALILTVSYTHLTLPTSG